MENTDTNYKNRLISWAQRNGHVLSFEILEEQRDKSHKLFTIGILMNGELLASGNAYSKKEAGQVAAQKAILLLQVP
jgi:ribonuclease-3